MSFSHEKLDVYRAAIEYIRWAFYIAGKASGMHRHARDQLLRASQSIPLNIAEANGKATENDRRHFFEIARGSTFECAAIQDVLEICNAITPAENQKGKDLLDRIAAMLTKIGGRGYGIKEEPSRYINANRIGSRCAKMKPTPQRKGIECKQGRG
jgi:four helix bundle protein